MDKIYAQHTWSMKREGTIRDIFGTNTDCEYCIGGGFTSRVRAFTYSPMVRTGVCGRVGDHRTTSARTKTSRTKTSPKEKKISFQKSQNFHSYGRVGGIGDTSEYRPQ